jgi:hypothetical protein
MCHINVLCDAAGIFHTSCVPSRNRCAIVRAEWSAGLCCDVRPQYMAVSVELYDTIMLLFVLCVLTILCGNGETGMETGTRASPGIKYYAMNPTRSPWTSKAMKSL